jgi:hypothetical protein
VHILSFVNRSFTSLAHHGFRGGHCAPDGAKRMLRYHGVKDYFTTQSADSDQSFSDDLFSTGIPITPLPYVGSQIQALYETEPGNANAISYTDIYQGQIGDCFVLSPLGEIAMEKPSFISNMIKVNANGTESVTLYESADGALLTPYTNSALGFRAVVEVVTNRFPGNSVNNGANQDVVDHTKEIWPQVIEKAVAQLDGGDPGGIVRPNQRSFYTSIQYRGEPAVAMETLTGKAATSVLPSQVTLAFLTSVSNAGDLITFDTKMSVSADNLVGNHCYMFESVTGSGDTAVVHLANPWGFNQPPAILVSSLSQSFARIDIGHVV